MECILIVTEGNLIFFLEFNRGKPDIILDSAGILKILHYY